MNSHYQPEWDYSGTSFLLLHYYEFVRSSERFYAELNSSLNSFSGSDSHNGASSQAKRETINPCL